jgi:hypothetical protein
MKTEMEQLQLLRNEELLSLARNPAANLRTDAIRLLIERGSSYVGHADIAAAAGHMIFREPALLKKCDPGAEVLARKLPGLLDVVATEVKKTHELEQKAGECEGRHVTIAAAVENLRSELDDIKREHREGIDQIFKKLDATHSTAEARPARLERSLWRKFVDWIKLYLVL